MVIMHMSLTFWFEAKVEISDRRDKKLLAYTSDIIL
jgi:hypothetical protein